MEHDELTQYLDSLKREDCYRIDETLKESAYEVTQHVYFVGENGSERGPYIRKFIQRESGLGSAYQRVFEAQQNGCRFKHVPDILECYTRDGQLVVVMEYVQGETLQESVYQNDPSPELACRVFPQICDAVTELHTEFDPPIIHRDLKPSNIVLTGHGLVLIDFGISREYNEHANFDTSNFGTREFAPPEQFGFGQTGVYSDVYALGMVLYYCLTEQIPSPRARKENFADPHIPEHMREVIERACALDPAMRYADVAELKDAFLRASSAISASNEQTRQAELSCGASAIKRRIAIGAVAVACALAAAIGALVAFSAMGNMADEPKRVQTQSSSQAQNSSGVQSSGDTSTREAASESIRYYVIDDAAVSAQERENFYYTSKTFTESAAGVEFEIPAYFETNAVVSSGNARAEFPKAGPSFAMIIVEEQSIDEGWESGEQELSRLKDEFVMGVREWNTPFYRETLVAPVDYEIDGLPARTVLFGGTVNGSTAHTQMLCYLNPEQRKIGAIYLCQSAEDRYSYSNDFTKVFTSAKRGSE